MWDFAGTPDRDGMPAEPFAVFARSRKARTSLGMLGAAAALAGCGGGGGGGGAAPSTGGGDQGGDDPGGGNQTGGDGPSDSANPLASLTVDAGSDIVPINLSAAYFDSDAEGELMFTVTLEGGEALSTVGLRYEDGRIVGTLDNAGSVAIRVVAAEAGGESSVRTFNITAEAPAASGGRPMVQAAQLAGDLYAAVGGPIDGVDVTSGFEDPDGGEGLVYDVQFSRTGHGLSFDASTGEITGTFTGTEDVTAIVTITNGEGGGSVQHRIVIMANQPPVAVSGQLGDVTAVVGQRITSIDLGEAFSDPDGTDLSFMAQRVDGSTLSALAGTGLSLSGDMISGTPTTEGSLTIRVTATDENGASTSRDFTVTASAANGAPTATSSAEEEVTPERGVATSLDLSDWFSDPDGDTLSFSATARAGGQTVTLDSVGLTLATNGMMTGTFTGSENVEVTVTASDGNGGMDTHTFTIMGLPNRSPAATDMVLTEVSGGAVSINLSMLFTDPDGDSLTYSATVGEDGGDLNDAELGLMLTDDGMITGTFTGSEDVVVTVTASDGRGDEAMRTFTVTVSGGNEDPMTTSSALSGVVSTGLPIDLSTWFNDPEEDTLTYSVTAQEDGDDIELDSVGLMFEGAMISGDFTGTEEVVVTVTASDGGGGETTHSFTLRMSNEDPTAVTGTAPATVDPGTDLPIDLSVWFSDSDMDTLTFMVTAQADGDDITLESVGLTHDGTMITGTFTGTEAVEVTVTATDGFGGMNATHTFTISGPNQPPAVVTGTALATVDPGANLPIDLSTWFSDPDGDTLTYSVTQVGGVDSNMLTRGLMLDGSMISGTFTGKENLMVTVTATDADGSGEEVTHTFTIMGLPNRAPAVVTGTALTTVDPATDLPIDMSTWFNDPDGDDLTYTVTARVGGTVTDLSTLGLTFAGTMITGAYSGSQNVAVTVQVDDGDGGTEDHTFTITGMGNRPPLVATVVTTVDPGTEIPINLGNWFNDPDRDTLMYTVTAAVGGSTITLGEVGLTHDDTMITGTFTGKEDVMVTVMASDGSNSAEHTVTVTGLGDLPPTVVASVAPPSVSPVRGERIDWDLNTWFNDRNRDTLVYTVTAEENGNAIALGAVGLARTGASISGTFTGKEDVMVSVMASDGNMSVTHNFTIMGLGNRLPMLTGTELSTVDHNSDLPIILGDWFNDPDRDSLTYTATATVGETTGGLDTIGLTISGGNILLRGAAYTQKLDAMVTVTADDGDGGRVMHTFTVTGLGNEAPVATSLATQAGPLDGIAPIVLSTWFSDADRDPLMYSATTRVNGTEVDLNTAGLGLMIGSGQISGPFTGSQNTYVTISATDGYDTATITVEFVLAGTTPLVGAAGVDELVDSSIHGRIIRGLGGNDTITGGAGNDTIDGGAGNNDVAVYRGTRDEFDITPQLVDINGSPEQRIEVTDTDVDPDTNTDDDDGTDSLRNIESIRFSDGSISVSASATAGADILFGTNSPDTSLNGGGGADIIFGFEDDDTITGGAGDDTIQGGAGMDTARFSGALRDFQIRGSGTDIRVTDSRVQDGLDEGADRLREIEIIRFGTESIETDNIHFGTGSPGEVTGNSSEANYFYGMGGGFTFIGGSEADVFQFLTAEDSGGTRVTTLRGFDASQDRIALADVFDLKSLVFEAVQDIDGTGITRLSSENSDFSLDIAGTHDFNDVAASIYFIGGTADSDLGGLTSNSSPTTGVFGLADRNVRAVTQIMPIPVHNAFHDPDGDDLTFTVTGLPSGLTYDSNTGLITGHPAQFDLGSHTVTVEADDGSVGGIFSQTFTLTVDREGSLEVEILHRLNSGDVNETRAVPDGTVVFTKGEEITPLDFRLLFNSLNNAAFNQFIVRVGNLNTVNNPDEWRSLPDIETFGLKVENGILSGTFDGNYTGDTGNNPPWWTDEAFQIFFNVTTQGSPNASYGLQEDPTRGESTSVWNWGLAPTITVTVNTVPRVSATPLEDQFFTLDSTITPISVSTGFEDPDTGSRLTFSVSGLEGTGLIFGNNMISGTFTGIPDGRGERLIIVTATDQHGYSFTDNFVVRPARELESPLFTLENRTVSTGSPITPIPVDGAFKISDGDDLSFTFSVGSQRGTLSSIGLEYNNATGLITGSITNAASHEITVEASDGKGGASIQMFTITSEDPGGQANRNPVVLLPRISGGAANETRVLADGTVVFTKGMDIAPIDIKPLFNDPDNDALTYEAWVGRLMVPDNPRDADNHWERLDHSNFGLSVVNGVISGTLSGNYAGVNDGSYADDSFEIVLRASDGNGGYAHLGLESDPGRGTSTDVNLWGLLPTFNVAVNTAPRISGTPLEDVIVSSGGAEPRINLSTGFEDPDPRTSLTYSVVGLDGTGLRFSGNTISGIFTGLPAGLTEREVLVTATDEHGASVTDQFKLIMNSAPESALFPLIDRTVSTGSPIVPIAVDGGFSDPDGDDLTLSFSVGSQNNSLASIGLAYDNTTGLITGTITDAASHDIVVEASDGKGGEHRQEFTITAEAGLGGRDPEILIPRIGGGDEQRVVNDGTVVFTQGREINPIDIRPLFNDRNNDALLYNAYLGIYDSAVHPQTQLIGFLQELNHSTIGLSVENGVISGTLSSRYGSEISTLATTGGFTFSRLGTPTAFEIVLLVEEEALFSTDSGGGDRKFAHYGIKSGGSSPFVSGLIPKIVVTVNRAPEESATPYDDVTVTEGSVFPTIDLSDGFNDPDPNARLSFTVLGLEGTGLIAGSDTISGIFSGFSGGETEKTITVWATDQHGAATSQTFKIMLAGSSVLRAKDKGEIVAVVIDESGMDGIRDVSETGTHAAVVSGHDQDSGEFPDIPADGEIPTTGARGSSDSEPADSGSGESGISDFSVDDGIDEIEEIESRDAHDADGSRADSSLDPREMIQTDEGSIAGGVDGTDYLFETAYS